jgi:hypothetical protein
MKLVYDWILFIGNLKFEKGYFIISKDGLYTPELCNS